MTNASLIATLFLGLYSNANNIDLANNTTILLILLMLLNLNTEVNSQGTTVNGQCLSTNTTNTLLNTGGLLI